MLIQEALKSQMADKVRKQEEQEQLESMPLMELLRLVAGPSQREEVDRVRCLLYNIFANFISDKINSNFTACHHYKPCFKVQRQNIPKY